MLTLGDLCEALMGIPPARGGEIPISDVVVDSRQCGPGAVFVALAGERQDGHAYGGEALARGAVAVIAEERVRGQGLGGNLTLIDVAGLQPNPSPVTLERGVPAVFVTASSLGALQRLAAYYRRKFPQLVTVGVTGSVGKSSTKELIYAVLRQRFVTLKTRGNLNNEIGVPLTALQLDEKYQRAVFEMGMYALGEIRALCDIVQPHIGVVTNVGPVHLERLGTMEKIAQAKGELVEALPGDGFAILNGDDPRVCALREKSRAAVMLYGLAPTNDIWADEIEGHGLEGIEFALHYGRSHLHVHVPLLGQHIVHNVLAAAAVGLAQDLSWEEILRGLQDVSAQLRLISAPGKRGITILDDTYNASPASTLAALNLVSELNGRKIVVLGDMLELGSYEQEGHRLVGLRAAEVADVVIGVGTRGKLIGAAALEAGRVGVSFAEDNTAAVKLVEQLAQPGDIVLVKGSRGAHLEDIVAALQVEESEGDAR